MHGIHCIPLLSGPVHLGGAQYLNFESERIYENVNASLSESHNDLIAESLSVNISEKSTTVDSQDNLGYFDDETSQNKTNFNPRQNETDDKNTYVIQIETIVQQATLMTVLVKTLEEMIKVILMMIFTKTGKTILLVEEQQFLVNLEKRMN